MPHPNTPHALTALHPTQLNDDEMMFYARQLLVPQWDEDSQLALKRAHVLMIGVGGLGCPIAETLTRAGVGTLTLVDFDTIEASNLLRQTLFTHDDIGASKALTAKTRLQHISPWVNIHTITTPIENSTLHFADYTLVIDCSDNFATRDFINRQCVSAGVDLLSTAAIGLTGQIALYTHDDACYHCVFGNEPTQNATSCATSGVLASTTPVVASLAAHHALLYLGLQHNVLKNQLLIWDGLTMQVRRFTFTADPQCSVCKPYRHL